MQQTHPAAPWQAHFKNFLHCLLASPLVNHTGSHDISRSISDLFHPKSDEGDYFALVLNILTKSQFDKVPFLYVAKGHFQMVEHVQDSDYFWKTCPVNIFKIRWNTENEKQIPRELWQLDKCFVFSLKWSFSAILKVPPSILW